MKTIVLGAVLALAGCSAEGRSYPPCAGGAECPEGQACIDWFVSTDGGSEHRPFCAPACETEADCADPPGDVRPFCAGAHACALVCNDDAQCAPGACVGGLCGPR
jgi:hypothetical protein